MPGLRIRCATRAEFSDQLLTAGGDGALSQPIPLLLQPLQDRHRTGRCIEPNAIGQTCIACGVIGQHQGDALVAFGGLAQRNPAFGELNAPGHTGWIGLVALDRALQGLVFLRQLLESANSRHQPAIEFRQSHLHGQIQGAEANGTGLPTLLAA